MSASCRRQLGKIFDSEEFRELAGIPDGKTGTHSFRKLPATYARRSGCTNDDIECRGRWRRFKRQVNTYVDVHLPYKDGKVAAALCVGGPVRFEAKPGSGVEGQMGDEWLVGGLMSKVQDRYGAEVAKTLGWLALLHAVLDEDDEGVPTCVRNRVLPSYAHVKMLEDGEQAISMVPLNV